MAGFSNPLPTDASYFPIGVWFESVLSQADVDRDKDVGLNTYVVLTTNSSLSLLRANGMGAFVQQDQWLASAALGSETPGWLLDDEIDMEMSPDAGYAEVLRLLGTLPADGRLRFNNYGKGVMFWETDAQAARYVNAVHLASNDIYWFTDPNVCGISEGGALFAGRHAGADRGGVPACGQLRLCRGPDAVAGESGAVAARVDVRRGRPSVHGERGADDPGGRDPRGGLAQPDRRGAGHHLLQPLLRRLVYTASTSCVTRAAPRCDPRSRPSTSRSGGSRRC